jgi:hypothetical protein
VLAEGGRGVEPIPSTDGDKSFLVPRLFCSVLPLRKNEEKLLARTGNFSYECLLNYTVKFCII